LSEVEEVGMVRGGAGAGYAGSKGVDVVILVLYPGKMFPAGWSPDKPFVLVRQRLVEKDLGLGRTGASGARQFGRAGNSERRLKL